MDKIVVWISLFVFAFSCNTSKNIDSIVTREWDKCSGEKVCVINFANLMWFEWDTMCFYSGAYSLEDINKDLGFKFEKFVDIGDRVIFLNKGRVVYHKEWCNYSENSREGIIFKTKRIKFRLNKSESEFKVKKEKKLYILESIFLDSLKR